MKTILGALAAALALSTIAPAYGQAYPTKPIRIVAPFAPGGGTDFIARQVADRLSQKLGQPVLVENRPGAGGNLGAEIAIKSPADGYTLLLIAGSFTVNASMYKLPYDSGNDITPIIQLSQGPFVVVVPTSLKANNLKELIALAKAQPDKLSYASSGAGSITQLATELFLEMAKIKIVHVPYKGTGPAQTDTIAGTTQLLFGSVATTLPFAKQGRLRALAVTTSKRIAAAPEIPTVAEAGVPGYDVILWHGLIGPKGIPKPIVDKLNAAANEVMKDKAMEEKLAGEGVTPAGGTSAQFGALIKSDIARWAKVIKQADIKVE
ncbi:MAG TPA: tripartite tricarboxylate transporter substrate binding protein [Burkholderiales bacterium]|jgi:tripartite-type tricarboxylate transporter receptor subunit TctC|nr:tripartite tricarboxylate transporter substrate binding protein [Burkholderiales bacterium]